MGCGLQGTAGTARPTPVIHHQALAGPDGPSSTSGDKPATGSDEPDVSYRHLHLKTLIWGHELMEEAGRGGIMGLALLIPF